MLFQVFFPVSPVKLDIYANSIMYEADHPAFLYEPIVNSILAILSRFLKNITFPIYLIKKLHKKVYPYVA